MGKVWMPKFAQSTGPVSAEVAQFHHQQLKGVLRKLLNIVVLLLPLVVAQLGVDDSYWSRRSATTTCARETSKNAPLLGCVPVAIILLGGGKGGEWNPSATVAVAAVAEAVVAVAVVAVE